MRWPNGLLRSLRSDPRRVSGAQGRAESLASITCAVAQNHLSELAALVAMDIAPGDSITQRLTAIREVRALLYVCSLNTVIAPFPAKGSRPACPNVPRIHSFPHSGHSLSRISCRLICHPSLVLFCPSCVLVDLTGGSARRLVGPIRGLSGARAGGQWSIEGAAVCD